jgi:hypothetical protein
LPPANGCGRRRDVRFVGGLIAERVQFVVTELRADVDPFLLHLYVALAEILSRLRPPSLKMRSRCQKLPDEASHGLSLQSGRRKSLSDC